MTATEPASTATILAGFGLLAGFSVLFSRASDRAGIPLALLFLAIGMLAGSEVLGLVPFDDYELAFRLGIVAMVLILFDGGLNTPRGAFGAALAPASLLATLGVVGTAGLLGLCAFAMGFPLLEALLLGSIVSSTDAAAVFAVLRGSGLRLKRRVGFTIELESGLNDPMAVILTLGFAEAMAAGTPLSWMLGVRAVLQLAIGAAIGAALGLAARRLMRLVLLPASGLYPVLTVAIAALSYGLATLLEGSGFLAVYLSGAFLGNSLLPYKTGLRRVHDALAWLSQIVMFLVLGLLVRPTHLVEVALTGLALALLLSFFARPVVVWLLLLPFRFPVREVGYIAWVGLRGAVPIVLATFPVLAGVPHSQRIFDVVFFIVVVNALFTGGSVRWMTRKLGLESGEPPAPPAVLEIASTRLLHGEVLSFFIDHASAVSGSRIADLPFPPGTAVMLIVRGEKLLAPHGPTQLQPGDHVYLFCDPEERGLVQLLFGRSAQG